MIFKAKVGERTYTLERLTTGELRILKAHFGVTDLTRINFADPDVIVGLLYLALRREQPERTHADLLAEVEGLDIQEFEGMESGDPPTAAAEDGSPATTLASSGNPS